METALVTPSAVRKRGRPTKYQPGIEILTQAYLDSCQDVFDVPTRLWHVRLPTVEGFSLYLGVHRDTLYRWAKIYPDYEHALERIMRIQYVRLVNGGLSGRYKASLVILMLKRNHWKRMTSMRDWTNPHE